MNILQRYLGVMFLTRWATTTFGMLALVVVLDSLSAAEFLPEGSGLAARLRYMSLRAPVLFDRIFLFALLLGVLLTFVSLIRRNELVSIVAAGVSAFGQIRALAPVVIAVAALSALVIDLSAPPAVRALDAWLGEDAPGNEFEQGQSLWLAEDEAFIEIEETQGDVIHGVTLYHRGEAGEVEAVTTALRADYDGGLWRLAGARQRRFDGSRSSAPHVWRTPQTPATLQKLGADPRNLAARDLLELAGMRGSGSQPSTAYFVWAFHRFTLPLSGLAFVLFAAPLMQRLGRRNTGDIGMIVGVLIGFAFLILDGVLKTMSAAGGMPAWSAAAIPLGLLSLAGLHLLMHTEHPA